MATPPSSSSFLKAKGASDQLLEVRQPSGAAQCLSGDAILQVLSVTDCTEVLYPPACAGMHCHCLLFFTQLCFLWLGLIFHMSFFI